MQPVDETPNVTPDQPIDDTSNPLPGIQPAPDEVPESGETISDPDPDVPGEPKRPDVVGGV